MVAGDRQRIDDDAAIDADHRQHHAQKQTEAEAGEQEPEQVVPDVPVGEVHRLPSRITRTERPSRIA
jgi:hypothetical protein